MKKQIIVGTAVIACVALCAAVWPWSAEVGDLSAEPVKSAVSAEFAAQPLEKQHISISSVSPDPEVKPFAENTQITTEATAEKEVEKTASTQTMPHAKPAAMSSEPHMGDVRVVNGEKQVYFLGFGWIKDEGIANIGTVAEDMYENGNKIGVMGGSTTVDGDGDINKQIGIMGSGEGPSSETPPPSAEPEPAGDVIYTELQPPVTKDSTPPPYKPNGEPTNP